MDTLPTGADGHAFFLDFDGTLVDIAPTPDGVVVARALPPILTRLQERAGGAVAVVSGRTIDALDRFLAPAKLAAAGVHGAEVRFSDGRRVAGAAPQALAAVRAAFETFTAAHSQVLLEDKGVALSLHYRAAPELEAAARACAETAIAGVGGGLAVQPGKMVVEVRPAGADKGRAVETLMGTAPFQGRRPVAVGDDLTDEHMFAVARDLGGMAIRVGTDARTTLATLTLPDSAAVHSWLADVN